MTIKTNAKIREWGNSFGIVVPKELAEKEGIMANDKVAVIITKKRSLEDFFGKGKNKIENIQKEKNEAKKVWKMN